MSRNRDRIEFYIGGVNKGIHAAVESSHAPLVGEKISIRKVTYTVTARSWALDHADEFHMRELCCVVILEKDDQ
jgi:hypothetical protein